MRPTETRWRTSDECRARRSRRGLLLGHAGPHSPLRRRSVDAGRLRGRQPGSRYGRQSRVIARNQDDHVKNIAFLMDKAGRWSLAPAFDMTHSYNPTGSWTAAHQMTMNGKRDGFTLADFRACAKSALMKRGRAEAIIEEVRAAVARWPDYAEQGQVANEWRKQIQRNQRLELQRT